MTEALTPTVVCEEATETYGRFSIEPLESGLGVTLGNPLRRVLLALLPGAAVTSVKIEGVQHEFSSIPHMKEDVTEFLLNIKGIRLCSLTGRPGKLMLEVKGEGEATAGDIVPSADFEIVNPELHLATLDSAEASLNVELEVSLGQGYVATVRGDGVPIGVIPVDAIFTPLRRVNYRIERARGSSDPRYERLVLEILTDGTITPGQALARAAQRLGKELSIFAGVERVALLPAGEKPPLPLGISQETYDTPVEQLGLTSRTLNCLRRSGIMKLGALLEKTPQELMAIRNFGEKSFAEVQERLGAMGLVPRAAEAAEVTPLALEELVGEEEPVGQAVGEVGEKDVQE